MKGLDDTIQNFFILDILNDENLTCFIGYFTLHLYYY